MEAERRQVTVLTDMVGFTTFSERSGEEAVFTLMRFVAALRVGSYASSFARPLRFVAAQKQLEIRLSSTRVISGGKQSTSPDVIMLASPVKRFLE